MIGGIWEDSRKKREMLVITKDESGLSGSHKRGSFHSKAQGVWGRVPTLGGYGWGGWGAPGPVMEVLECRAWEQTLCQGHWVPKKLLRRGNVLIIFIHFQVHSGFCMDEAGKSGHRTIEFVEGQKSPELEWDSCPWWWEEGELFWRQD